MARINIEDSIFRDIRFLNLITKVGSVDAALGSIVRAWIIAQEYWKKDKSLVPTDVWKRQMLSDFLIDVGLAERREHGIYVAGSDEQFAWLLQKVEAGKKGGQKSSQSRKRDSNNLDESGTKRSEAQASAANPPSPSLSPSLPLTTYSSSDSNSPSKKKVTKPVRGDKAKTERNRRIWQIYSDAYRERYGVEPLRNAKVNQQVSMLGDRVGEDEVVDLIRFYLAHNKHFYVQNTHSIGICLNDCETLRTQMLTNKPITQIDARNVEKAATTASQLDRFKRLGTA